MSLSNRFLFILCMVIAMSSCETRKKISSGKGYVDVNGGKIWYKVVGEGDKTPVVMLHGGPGYPGYYLNPLMALGKERPVITFHQLGCGRSDRITDTTLMTIDNHIDQVNKLLDALDVKDFYLYGHSWGTMLGIDYYLKNSDRIKGLILASPCLSSKLWVADADTLIASLPDSVQLILRNNIKGVPQDSSTLTDAINVYFSHFYMRKQPLSADIDSMLAEASLPVYHHMWGTSEFFVLGTLKNYDRTNDLSRVNVPTLYITGEYDAARPVTVKYYQSLTPNSLLKIIPNAGHTTMHDNAAEDIKVISEFLNAIDNHN